MNSRTPPKGFACSRSRIDPVFPVFSRAASGTWSDPFVASAHVRPVDVSPARRHAPVSALGSWRRETGACASVPVEKPAKSRGK